MVSILYTGLEALRLRPPDYEYLDRFVSGSRAQDDEGKSDDQYDVGRWHRKKSAQ